MEDQAQAKVHDIGAAREEAIRKNMIAIVDHGNMTRKLVVEQGAELERLRNMIGTVQNQMKVMDDQLSAMQVKVYSGLVSSSGD